VAHQIDIVPVAAPGLEAARSRGDELYWMDPECASYRLAP
jgi:hypothetical protein